MKYSFTQTHSPDQSSSPFLAELISVNFYSCNTRAHKRGVRRSKLKRPREHRQSSIDLLYDEGKKKKMPSKGERKRKIYERRNWLKFQKMFERWLSCVMPLNFFDCLWSSPPPLPPSLLSSNNRQILITWQSSGISMLIHFQLSNEKKETPVLVNLINTSRVSSSSSSRSCKQIGWVSFFIIHKWWNILDGWWLIKDECEEGASLCEERNEATARPPTHELIDKLLVARSPVCVNP